MDIQTKQEKKKKKKDLDYLERNKIKRRKIYLKKLEK